MKNKTIHQTALPEAGDTVVVTTKGGKEIEGVVMPSKETGALILKLSSGYNIGIDPISITSIRVLKKAEQKAQRPPAVHQANKKLPTIAVLHTGGTIASKVDYATGGVVASFTADDLLFMFPDIKELATIRTVAVDNIMSEDMRFSHYQKIARAAKIEIEKGADGIIVGHGTDTLGITAAALAFMFEELPVPIILVGAQRSSDRPSTDAAGNLLSAATFITKTDFAGVALCMHERMDDDACLILPATKTRKLHTTRRDAFKAVNASPIARVKAKEGKVEFMVKEHAKKDIKQVVVLKDKLEEKVGILRAYPNMPRDTIDIYTKMKYKGIVLEGTGLGQAPTNIPEHEENYKALQEFIKQGGVIVLTSQCIFGRVNRDVYTNTRRLGNIGVIYGEDMLTETAFVKLAWLLGNYPIEEAKRLLPQNMRGEISARTNPALMQEPLD